jgi:hypothetical protein
LPSKWKGKGRAECLDLINEGEWVGEEKYAGKAVKVTGPEMIVWVNMKGTEVGGVKVFMDVGDSEW